MVKKDLFYTESHEWVKVNGETAYIGITDYAQHELGDIVYVELPQEGDDVTSGEAFGSIEAVKAVEDLISPVSGQVVAVNTDLENEPEIINKSAFEDGWLIKIKLSDESEIDKLMPAGEYEKIIEE